MERIRTSVVLLIEIEGLDIDTKVIGVILGEGERFIRPIECCGVEML